MVDQQARRRAPGMSPEERRKMIVSAALPLVAEYGTAITTSQIARAAGIGEATIFRAFNGKEDVLDACIAEAISSERVLGELASIDITQSLQDRLTDAADAIRAYYNRMGAVIGNLYATGHKRPREAPDKPTTDNRAKAVRVLSEALAELIEPDRASLRIPPARLADVFIGLTFGGLRAQCPGEELSSTTELVDVLLHGVLVAEA